MKQPGTGKSKGTPRKKPEAICAQKCTLRGLSKDQFAMLLEMCGYANSLANSALWHIRHFFARTGKYLPYEKN